MLKEGGTIEQQDVFHPSYRYLIEMIGTFLLTLGTLIAYESDTSGDSMVASIVSGFLRTAIMYTAGPISGGHLSPMISISVHIRRSHFLSLKNLLGYLLAQALGVIVRVWRCLRCGDGGNPQCLTDARWYHMGPFRVCCGKCVVGVGCSGLPPLTGLVAPWRALFVYMAEK